MTPESPSTPPPPTQPNTAPASQAPTTPSGPIAPKKRLPWPLVAITILVLAVVAGTVYYLLNHKTTPATPPQPAKIAVTTAPSTKDNDWTIVTKPDLELTENGVNVTLPAALVSKAVYQYDSGNLGYVFSLRSIVDNSKCSLYFTDNLQETFPGIELWHWAGTVSAEGQIGPTESVTETLSDYYAAHKSAAGNYFTDPTTSRNYYKIGSDFYSLESDSPAFHQEHLADFKANCPSVDPDWQQVFVDAMSTLSAT